MTPMVNERENDFTLITIYYARTQFYSQHFSISHSKDIKE